ncbi:hypothetical protein ACEE90_03540 [Corynebacterium phoceense]
MTIDTRNEVLVTCENTPLMELLEHLAKDHAPDLDYCLENLGLDYTVASKPRPKKSARTIQEFFELSIGTIVEFPGVGLFYKIAFNAWVKPKDLPYSLPLKGNDDMARIWVDIEAPARILFTPEVQA